MATQHVRFGGSSIHRVMECPASVPRQETIPYRTTSDAATRGSALHNLAEHCFVNECAPDPFIGKVDQPTGYQFNERDLEHVQMALDAVEEVCTGLELFDYVTEIFVSYDEDVGGSADIIAWNDTIVAVLDYKFGSDPVDVRSNPQALFYAGAALADKKTQSFIKGKRIVIGIIQPAVMRSPQLYEVPVKELVAFTRKMHGAIKLARGDVPPARAGDHCKYCAFAPHCPERRAQANRWMALDPAIEDQLIEGLELIDQMKAQIKALEAAGYEALAKGYPVRGWKLVEKMGNRQWRDEAVARATLRGVIDDPKVYLEEPALRSPTQLEKVLKKAGIVYDFKPLVTRESTGNTMVPETDPRPAVVVKLELPDNLKKLMGGA
jgi:hypothetical protein